MTDNLTLSQMTAAQNQKHVTHNDSNGELDAALTAVQAYAVDESNAVAVSLAEQQRASIFHLTEASPSPTGAISMTFPATTRGLIVVINDTGQSVTVEIAGSPTQSETPPTVSANTSAVLIHDGVNVRAPA